MNDAIAQAAYDEYREIIRRYRNPSIVPELNGIMQDLCEAVAYFNAIPRDQRTVEQDRLRIKISGLLMKD